MLDIIPKIISEINDSTISFENIQSPTFYIDKGAKLALPSLAVAERGGSESGYHRVLFTVRAEKIGASRGLAIQVIDLMEAMLDPELKRQKINGGLEDKVIKGAGETIFYMLFYTADSD